MVLLRAELAHGDDANRIDVLVFQRFQVCHIARRIDAVCLERYLPQAVDVILCPGGVDHDGLGGATGPGVDLHNML